MFGGQAGGVDSNETWLFEAGRWSLATGAMPSARSGAAMAYDAARDRIVLFGGYQSPPTTPSLISDTWLFDGQTWTRDLGATHPTGKWSQTMAYDPIAGCVVLFGGRLDDETWEWDGSAWTRRSAGGLANSGPGFGLASMTYDPGRGRVVLFLGAPNVALWGWDHVSGKWDDLSPSLEPSPRAYAVVAWNATRRALTLFGGEFFGTAISYLGDTWELGPTGWQTVATEAAPEASGEGILVPDPAGAGAIAFGGLGASTVLSDTWRLRWDGVTEYEACNTGADLDGDGLAGCADPDCWTRCTPMCPPGAVQCDPNAPRCGDGVCDPILETCGLCPEDCGACPARCGDAICEPGESIASCPGDCTL